MSKRTLQVGDLAYDLDTLEVSRGGRHLKLNPLGLKILEILMKRSPNVVRRDALEEATGGTIARTATACAATSTSCASVIDKPSPSRCCTPCMASAIDRWRSLPMWSKPGLAQRIIIAFTVMTTLVAGAFALGIVGTAYTIEERLISQTLGGRPGSSAG